MLNSHLARLTAALAKSRRGATAIEYGLLAALVAVVISVGVASVGTNLQSTFTDVANKV